MRLIAVCSRLYCIRSPELKFLPSADCNRRRDKQASACSRERIWPYSKYSTHAVTYRCKFLEKIMCRQVAKAAFCNTDPPTSTYACCVRCFDLPVWNVLCKFCSYVLYQSLRGIKKIYNNSLMSMV